MMQVLTDFGFVIVLFLIISTLYSSVGFGGGSSYLAVLALTTLTFTEIKTAALFCNIIVVSSNVILCFKNKLIDWHKIIPLTILSVPLAFLGGYLKISEALFYALLGITLFIAALSMWNANKLVTNENSYLKNNSITNSIIGGFIGFVSGLVGIGGGIFLSPVLHISKWDLPKKIAAASSFFILVNSISGIFGQFTQINSTINYPLLLVLGFTVFIGGQIGMRISIRFLNEIQLKKATALLIAFIGIKILFNSVF